MRSFVWALIQYGCCPYEKGKLGHRHTHTEKRRCEDTGRRWPSANWERGIRRMQAPASSSSRVSSRDPRISWTGYGGGGHQASQTPTSLPWGCSLKRKAPVMEDPSAEDPVMQSTGIHCFTCLECSYPTQSLLHGLLTSL